MRDRKKDRRFGIEAAWFKTSIIGQIGKTDLRARIKASHAIRRRGFAAQLG
jgi:hypothetical protein